MNVVESTRRIVKKVLGVKGRRFVRRFLYGEYLNIDKHRIMFEGKRAIEIGGPSEIFCDNSNVPVYPLLGNVDNCLFSGSTIWFGGVQDGGDYRYDKNRKPGTQFICEGGGLETIPSSSYDVILSSHCLEHMANPLRALEGWRRVLKTEGCILLILPHKDGTFDWKRPLTPIAHMIRDYEQNAGEDDLTHLSEVLALHDLNRDKAAGSKEEFEQRCFDNSRYRAMHHHVFNTRGAVEMMNRANFQLIEVGAFNPFNIVLLAIKPIQQPDNSMYLCSDAEFIRHSPFRSDHPDVSQKPVPR